MPPLSHATLFMYPSQHKALCVLERGDEGSDSAYWEEPAIYRKNAITQLLATINRKQMYTQSIWKHLIRSLLQRNSECSTPKQEHCNSCKIIRWVGKIPRKRAQQPAPVFLPGEPHGQRSLAGYSPQCHKESDMTEAMWHAGTCVTIVTSRLWSIQMPLQRQWGWAWEMNIFFSMNELMQ